MSHHQEDRHEFFPEENYVALRRNYTPPAVETFTTDKPVEAPAWDKHLNELPPKPARFSKLTRWDERSASLQTVVKWVVVAAGAATIAGPAIMHLP